MRNGAGQTTCVLSDNLPGKGYRSGSPTGMTSVMVPCSQRNTKMLVRLGLELVFYAVHMKLDPNGLTYVTIRRNLLAMGSRPLPMRLFTRATVRCILRSAADAFSRAFIE